MHVYVFDQFLNAKKYEKIISKIETRITDLGLNGKNCRVGPLKSLTSIIKEEIKRNPKTVIVVGNNHTLNRAINSIDEEVNTIFGIIPIGKNNTIAETLGIENEDAALNILSARLVEKIDLGVINNTYFISKAEIEASGSVIEVNERYTIEPTGPGIIKIINLSTEKGYPSVSPQDSRLETFIKITKKGLLSSQSDQTFLSDARLIINNLNGHNFLVDETIEVKVPVQVSIAPKKLNIIVGKGRKF